MEQIEDLIQSGYDSLLDAVFATAVEEKLLNYYLAKCSFIEEQNILQKSMVSGDGPIGIPDEGVVDLVERWLGIVDRSLRRLGRKVLFGATCVVAILLFFYLFKPISNRFE